jgi:hypothetical protein
MRVHSRVYPRSDTIHGIIHPIIFIDIPLWYLESIHHSPDISINQGTQSIQNQIIVKRCYYCNTEIERQKFFAIPSLSD